MVSFVGVDLAWTTRYPSGVCIIDAPPGEEPVCTRLEAVLTTVETLADDIAGCGDHVLTAVDAPLILHDSRSVERLIASQFGRYKIGAHQAGRGLLEATGRMAGPLLAEALSERGFTLNPDDLEGRPGRLAFEVYPHAAHVRLFGLSERIPYKAKQGRRVADRHVALTTYRDLLVALLRERLPGVAASPPVMRWLAAPPSQLRGDALKGYEDVLDALTCAVVAHHAWLHGPDGVDILGDFETGFVAVPREAA